MEGFDDLKEENELVTTYYCKVKEPAEYDLEELLHRSENNDSNKVEETSIGIFTRWQKSSWSVTAMTNLMLDYDPSLEISMKIK
jgi:hypothetical protein